MLVAAFADTNLLLWMTKGLLMVLFFYGFWCLRYAAPHPQPAYANVAPYATTKGNQ